MPNPSLGSLMRSNDKPSMILSAVVRRADELAPAPALPRAASTGYLSHLRKTVGYRCSRRHSSETDTRVRVTCHKVSIFSSAGLRATGGSAGAAHQLKRYLPVREGQLNSPLTGSSL
jgi:hypothetical protein